MRCSGALSLCFVTTTPGTLYLGYCLGLQPTSWYVPPAPVEKYLGIPGILGTHTLVWATHFGKVSRDTGTTSWYVIAYPLWKNISGYPGYYADPRTTPY